MKRKIIFVLIFIVIFFSFPNSVYAADYGYYYSDEVIYPISNLPNFSSSSLINSRSDRLNLIIYNSNDNCFYLFVQNTRDYCANQISYFTIDNSGVLQFHGSDFKITYHKYDPNNSNSWVNQGSTTASSVISYFTCSSVNKIKVVWVSKTVDFSYDNYVYTVTPNLSDTGQYYIYANFFAKEGNYLQNDPAIENAGSSGGESGGGSTVDLSTTNNLLSTISSKLEDIKTTVNTISTNFFTKLTSIDNKLTTTNSTLNSISTVITNFKSSIEGRVDTIISNASTNVAAITSRLDSIIDGTSHLYEKLYGLDTFSAWGGQDSIYSFIRSMNSSLTNIKNELQRFSRNFVAASGSAGQNWDFAPYLFEYFDEIFLVDDEYNFFTNLHNMLLDLHTEIENMTNPMSEDNIDTFEASVEALKEDTFIGDAYTIIDSADTLKTALSGANPQSHLYVTTIGHNFFGAYIPARTIDIDFSWYGTYRTQVFSILRAFLYLAYFILLLRNIPSILGGASPLIDSPTQIEYEEIAANGDTMSRYTTTYTRNSRTTKHIK